MMLRLVAARALAVTAVTAVVGAAAACPEPFYDDVIGVEGVATETGSLQGTLALKSQAMDRANTVLGPVDTGGITYSLVTRTWREDEPARYDETHKVCDVENFETAGLTAVNTRATIDGIPVSTTVLDVDHASGAFTRQPFHEYWAVQNLDDNDPLPEDKTSAVFYDMDNDGNPGTTVTTSGLVDGEVYVAQRKTISHTGVVQGEALSFGLARVKKEGTVLGASTDLLLNEAERVPHPDPKQSWWMEIRIDDDAGCDAVIDARDSDALPIKRPF